MRFQFHHVTVDPVPVGRRVRRGDVYIGDWNVPQDDIHSVFRDVNHVFVQVPDVGIDIRQKRRGVRSVLADDGGGTSQPAAVPLAVRRGVPVRHVADKHQPPDNTVLAELGLGGFDIFRVHVHGEHMLVSGRGALREAVPHAAQTLRENQRGPGTPGRGGDHVPGGGVRAAGLCRDASDVRRRFLRPARRFLFQQQTTLGRQRGGSVADQTPADQRRRLRAHRFVRYPDGHNAVQSVRDDVV